MPLPDPARALSPSLQANKDAQDAQEKAEGLRLPGPKPAGETGGFSYNPIAVSALDKFEALFQDLKKQDRRLKRYQLAEALLDSADDETVRRVIVQRLISRQ